MRDGSRVTLPNIFEKCDTGKLLSTQHLFLLKSTGVTHSFMFHYAFLAAFDCHIYCLKHGSY